MRKVALREEGVDRNTHKVFKIVPEYASPSARRAWIEIFDALPPDYHRAVALLAEGVDRNIFE